MNKTKIEWTDFTWNPITGCTRGCHYCYASKMATRLRGRAGYNKENPFQPTFHANRLNEPFEMQRPSMIFVCSMGDFFGPGVSENWRESVYSIMTRTPWHVFQVLTKREISEPEERGNFPRNMWMGVSIDGTSNYWEKPLSSLKSCGANRKFISFEPLIGDNLPEDLLGIDWAIIGAQTGRGSKPPEQVIVRDIVSRLHRSKIPIFVKYNIRKHFNTTADNWWIMREEFPEPIVAKI